MLLVTEIFESVQGEGFNVGRVAIFIRFAGCNLKCPFCDTKYSWTSGVEMSVDSIVERVREYKSKFVVLTGGEPTIQSLENLEELVWRLHLLGYFVAIETNGTNVIDRKRLAFNWITVSPKSHDFQQRTGNELKLLYDGSQDLLYYESVGQFEFYYLQPILPERDLRYYQEDPDALVRFMRSVHKAVGVCVQAAITYPRWRVSFQSHKIVGVR